MDEGGAGEKSDTVAATELVYVGEADDAAAMPAACTNDCVVRLTIVGAGDVLGTPGAGDEGAERAEPLRPRSSAGDAAYAAPVCRQVVMEPHRGTCCHGALQPVLGTGSAHNIASESQTERTAFTFNSDTALRLHERAIRKRLQTADWNRLYRDKTGIYRPCILISQPERDKVRLVFRCDLAGIDACVRGDKTFLQRVNLDTVAQVKQSDRLKLFTLTLVDTDAEWTESAPLLLQAGRQTIAPLTSIPESRKLNNID